MKSFLKSAVVGIVYGTLTPGALATPLADFLSDPGLQPIFEEMAPNALDPAFLYRDYQGTTGADGKKPNFYLKAGKTTQTTGLVGKNGKNKLRTTVFGFGDSTISWPGQTIQVTSSSHGGGGDETTVYYENKLVGAFSEQGGRQDGHLLPVDTTLHWAYSLHGYENFTLDDTGIPFVPHVHGGKTDFQFDGNPEFFFSPSPWLDAIGPQWDDVQGGFTNEFVYDNEVPAGNLWYHDHALGLTRLNVYAGLAGFFFVRDNEDTGTHENPLDLPAFPYELAYAIQDRMFTESGELFYPAYPGDPAYDDFITCEEVDLTGMPDKFPVCGPVVNPGCGGPAINCGPTALAEFFGDHMVVNGKIWPKTVVEPRNYRMRLLNGCDSRFLVVQFVVVELDVTDPAGGTIENFLVIGSDQGLGTPETKDTLVIEPGGRYDVIFNFAGHQNKRVIMKNLGWDAPFGGDFGDCVDDCFANRFTDRIMAFDVTEDLDTSVPDNFSPDNLPGYDGVEGTASKIRRVALFEGTDEFGRLQPLLGTVKDDPLSGTDVSTVYTWSQPTTETPVCGTIEEWHIFNWSGDAHPVHLHLVNFEILERSNITFDSGGTQPVFQHNGEEGEAPRIDNVVIGSLVNLEGYYESAPKDMVTALPGQMVKIKVKFEKPGRYVWHCHILSHEDHEMMRVMEVTGDCPA